MNESRLRPKVVLWWGIGLAAAGLLLSVLVPQLFYAVALPDEGPTPLDQGLILFVDVVTRVFAQGVVPLGVALIGAAVVMSYIARRLAPADLPATDRSADDKGAAPVE